MTVGRRLRTAVRYTRSPSRASSSVAPSHPSRGANEAMPDVSTTTARGSAPLDFVADTESGGLSRWPRSRARTKPSRCAPRAPGALQLSLPRYAESGRRVRWRQHSVSLPVPESPESERARMPGTLSLPLPVMLDVAHRGSSSPSHTSSGWNMMLEWHEHGCCRASPYIGLRSMATAPICCVGLAVQGTHRRGRGRARALLCDHSYDMLIHVHRRRQRALRSVHQPRPRRFTHRAVTYASRGRRIGRRGPVASEVSSFVRDQRNVMLQRDTKRQ